MERRSYTLSYRGFRRLSRALVPAACLVPLALTACARTPAEKVEAEMATMRAEQTPERLVERGKAFAVVGDLTRAEEYLAAALDRGADARQVMSTLLDVCVRGGKYRSAIQHAENHLRKQPGDHNTRLVLGTLYYAVGDTRAARATLEKVVEVRPDQAHAHYVLALLARDTDNDVVAADRHFREYLRIEPAGEHSDEARDSLLKRVP